MSPPASASSSPSNLIEDSLSFRSQALFPSDSSVNYVVDVVKTVSLHKYASKRFAFQSQFKYDRVDVCKVLQRRQGDDPIAFLPDAVTRCPVGMVSKERSQSNFATYQMLTSKCLFCFDVIVVNVAVI